MSESKIKDSGLGEAGLSSLEWAESRMPVLVRLQRDFKREKPLKNLTIGACLHVTKETGVLMRVLMAGGASVALCGSNPLSTQDEIAAALVREGIKVYAWRGQNEEEYYSCINHVLDEKPRITLDDGADLVTTAHTKRRDALPEIKGGTEETTTGVMRLRAMADAGKLAYPIIAVNDAYTKFLFDNRYGTGQSTLDGIMRATSILIAGKDLIVAGYGWCGRGIAMRAHGMGATVTVVEVDPIKALEAKMDGFNVTSMKRAAEFGDIFVTATGDLNVIRKEHLKKMRDGVILANSGHFNVEISVGDLAKLSKSRRVIRPNVEEFRMRNGNRLYLIGEGRLVNLAAAEGHPSEVMMMSFANQALCVKHLAARGNELKPVVYKVPEEIDRKVAEMAVDALGIETEQLTPEQQKYLKSWESGTS